MIELTYPFDPEYILRKKKSIKRMLLERDGIKYVTPKIAILGGSTTNDIKLILELFLLDNGIRPEFYESEYNKFWEDGVFGNPELDAFKPDLVYIHTSSRNILNFPNARDSKEDVNAKLDAEYERFTKLWESLSARYGSAIIQNNFEKLPYRLLGNSDVSDYRGRLSFTAELNRRFYEYSSSHESFYINDIDYVSSCYGIKRWASAADWYRYKYAMSVSAIPEFAFNLSHIIKALYGKNKKAFSLDLDNTLWGGVVGDDGPENIKVGQEDATSEAYAEFQEYIKAHKDLGILLNINSKNDEENALAGLARPDSVLSKDDFTVIKANWENKEKNLIETASEINIGTDAFVFVDDNPVERGIVRENVPGVAVPDLGDVDSYIDILDGNSYFEVTSISADDLKRNEMYKANAERAKVQASFADYGEYLKSLEMTADIRPFSEMYMARIAELTNKSNQFNLTTKRYNLAQITELAAREDVITRYGKLVDKYGDNGVVAVSMGHVEGQTLHMDLWLMSCRVLKREMESAMMDEFVAEARRRGLKEIKGYYYPTAKNKMVKEFYGLQGFKLESEDSEGNSVWSLMIEDRPEALNRSIKVNPKEGELT